MEPYCALHPPGLTASTTAPVCRYWCRPCFPDWLEERPREASDLLRSYSPGPCPQVLSPWLGLSLCSLLFGLTFWGSPERSKFLD